MGHMFCICEPKKFVALITSLNSLIAQVMRTLESLLLSWNTINFMVDVKSN